MDYQFLILTLIFLGLAILEWRVELPLKKQRLVVASMGMIVGFQAATTAYMIYIILAATLIVFAFFAKENNAQSN